MKGIVWIVIIAIIAFGGYWAYNQGYFEKADDAMMKDDSMSQDENMNADGASMEVNANMEVGAGDGTH